jgi:hypothetical protein
MTSLLPCVLAALVVVADARPEVPCQVTLPAAVDGGPLLKNLLAQPNPSAAIAFCQVERKEGKPPQIGSPLAIRWAAIPLGKVALIQFPDPDPAQEEVAVVIGRPENAGQQVERGDPLIGAKLVHYDFNQGIWLLGPQKKTPLAKGQPPQLPLEFKLGLLSLSVIRPPLPARAPAELLQQLFPGPATLRFPDVPDPTLPKPCLDLHPPCVEVFNPKLGPLRVEVLEPDNNQQLQLRWDCKFRFDLPTGAWCEVNSGNAGPDFQIQPSFVEIDSLWRDPPLPARPDGKPTSSKDVQWFPVPGQIDIWPYKVENGAWVKEGSSPKAAGRAGANGRFFCVLPPSWGDGKLMVKMHLLEPPEPPPPNERPLPNVPPGWASILIHFDARNNEWVPDVPDLDSVAEPDVIPIKPAFVLFQSVPSLPAGYTLSIDDGSRNPSPPALPVPGRAERSGSEPPKPGPFPASGVYKDVLDAAIGKALVKVTDDANKKLVGLAAISFGKDNTGKCRWKANQRNAEIGETPRDVYQPVILIAAVAPQVQPPQVPPPGDADIRALSFQVQTPGGAILRQPATIEVYPPGVFIGQTGPSGEPCVVALNVDLLDVDLVQAGSLKLSAIQRLVLARETDGNHSVLGSTVIRFDFDRGCWVEEGLNESPVVQPVIIIKIPARLPLQVGAIDQSGGPAGPAEVAIYTLAGRCVRRGMSQISSPYSPEATERLDPAYQRLLVAVRKTWADGSPWGTMLITFDHNNWRPHAIYSPDGKAHLEFDDPHDRFFPLPNGNRWSAPPVLASLTLSPIPVVHAFPTPCDSGQALLPSPALLCSPAQEILPPYSVASGLAPSWARLPSALPPAARYLPSAAGPIANRDEAITRAGRFATPDLPWADFGQYWVTGASGTYWQTPVRP